MTTTAEALEIAVRHHQGGRLQAAERIYRQILAAEPNHADAIHLLGVIASQVGKHEFAVEYLQRAISLQGNVAFFHNSLGETYRALRRIPEAVACYRRALELKPDYFEAQCNLGLVFKEQGKLDEALACWRRALELKPDSADTHYNLGIAFKEQGRIDDAVACWRRALELKPDFAETHNNLGNVLREQGKLEEAVACYRRALALQPDFATAHYNLGNVLGDQGKLDDAVISYRRVLELQSDFAAAHSNLGNILRDQGEFDQAIACWRRTLALKPDLAEAHYNLGVALKDQGKLDEAVACCRQAVELKPDFAEAHNNLGNVLRDQGRLDEAAVCCRRALDLKPGYAEAHNNLGNALKDQGKLHEAAACYRRALELDPALAKAHYNLGSALEQTGDFPGAEDSFRTALRHDSRLALAHYNLAELLRGKLGEQDLAAMRRLLEERDLPDAQRLLLRFGLAQVLDARGEYAEAAEHLARGNALQLSEWRKRGLEYDPQDYESFVTGMIATCTPDFFARVRGFGLESELPVFVVGLPRSGTTLIEQILASHSRVFGAGEIHLAADTMAALGRQGIGPIDGLRQSDRETASRLASGHLEKLRAFSPAAACIVDKMPENYVYLGLLATLFPRAKLIHCRRDLRDVAVSCWMTHFQEVRWANDPQHITLRFQQYQRIMEHWRKVLPVPLLEVDYEELVADPEGVARRLVEWCGLEWEPSCLEFHQAKRPVTTASAVQVRQPVFRTSVGRWKHYERALAPLLDRLTRITIRPASS
jgi:tetratricopeptide (TPR) repeat protein